MSAGWVLFLFFCLDLLKKQRPRRLLGGGGWGEIKSAGPTPRNSTNKARERRARGREDPTRGGGARPHRRFSPPDTRGGWLVAAGACGRAPPSPHRRPSGPLPRGCPARPRLRSRLRRGRGRSPRRRNGQQRPLRARSRRRRRLLLSAARPRAGAASRRALSAGTAAERQGRERAESSLVGGLYFYLLFLVAGIIFA